MDCSAPQAETDAFIVHFYARKTTAMLDLFLATSTRLALHYPPPPPTPPSVRAQILNGDSCNGLKINQSRKCVAGAAEAVL